MINHPLSPSVPDISAFFRTLFGLKYSWDCLHAQHDLPTKDSACICEVVYDIDIEVWFGSLSGYKSQSLFSFSFLTDCHICFQNLLIFAEIHISVYLWSVSCGASFHTTPGFNRSAHMQGVVFIKCCSFLSKYTFGDCCQRTPSSFHHSTEFVLNGIWLN